MGELRFGISARHGGPTLLEGARGFARAIGTQLGRTVRLVVLEDYQKLLERVGGGLELAWLPPLVHVEAAGKGAKLVAVSQRSGALTYRSALLVHAESKHREVKDLGGARAAWTDPLSASGHLVPRLHLTAAGVTLADEAFVGSALAACSAVADGKADVCACFVRDRPNDPAAWLWDVSLVYPPAAWRLRAVDVTPAIPPDGVVISSQVEPALATSLEEILLKVHEDRAGREALKALMNADQLVATDAAVTASVARLRALLP
jgi:phosphonate transport system substrate-binding protein